MLKNALKNSFICGDCEIVLKSIPESSIDFVFTSPPYADKRDYGSEKSRISPDRYVDWFIPKAKEIYRVIKEDGSFVLNISDKVVDGFQHLYVFELVIALCKDVGFHLVRDYIWHNPATPPNVYSRGGYGRTKKSHEYCFWFSKGESWTFNMTPIRRPYKSGMKKLLNGNGGGGRSQNIRPSTHSFDLNKKWADNGGSDPGTVISISNTDSNSLIMKLSKKHKIKHPARFPEKLAEFFILAGTNEGDIVLDPFCGTGTTAAVSKRLNRAWIGIDTQPEYCFLSGIRIDSESAPD